MRITVICIVIMSMSLWLAQAQSLEKQFPKSFLVKVKNPSTVERTDEFIFLESRRYQAVASGFNENAFVVLASGQEIPSQMIRSSNAVGIGFMLEKIGAGEELQIQIRYNVRGVLKRKYPKRTQAELSHRTGGQFVNREYIGGTFKNVQHLRVPPEHKDHSWFIRYEGPGWESDKVGYRLYLDQRNAIDVFGKKTSDMVLQNIGQDGFDSYHEMQPWGMDVMKVGKALGLGSFGFFDGERVTRIEKTDSVSCSVDVNGDLLSSIRVNYKGWQTAAGKTDVVSDLSIHAGSPLTHHVLTTSKDIAGFCTGIVKDKNAIVRSFKGDAGQFGFLATFGKQSLNNDNLGLAIFFRSEAFDGFAGDEFNHVVKLRSVGGKTDYFFMASWEGSGDELADATDFQSYLEKISRLLAEPVQLQVSRK